MNFHVDPILDIISVVYDLSKFEKKTLRNILNKRTKQFEYAKGDNQKP